MNPNNQIMSLRLQFDAELEEAKQTAYAEGRKDEREASCVDELVAALKMAQRYVDVEGSEEEAETVAALLAKLEKS